MAPADRRGTALRPRGLRVLAAILLVSWALVCLFPLYWFAVTSVKSGDAVMNGPYYLPFIDFTPTLDAWRFVLWDASNNLGRQYLNSAVISLASTALTLLAATLLLYAATRLPAHGLKHRLLRILPVAALATRLLPPVVVVVPLYVMALHGQLLDTHVLLILVYAAVNLPVALWLLRPVIGLRASEQEEAARLEGASHLSIVLTVILPMAAAGFAAAGLLVLVQCWNEYLLAVYLTTDRAMTLPPFLIGQLSIKEAQVGGDAEEWAQFSAATVLAVIPILACTAFAQRALAAAGRWRQ